MKKILFGAVAVVLSIGLSVSSADARGYYRNGPGIAGGFIAGAIIGGALARPYYGQGYGPGYGGGYYAPPVYCHQVPVYNYYNQFAGYRQVCHN